MTEQLKGAYADKILSMDRVEENAYHIRVQITETRVAETICRFSLMKSSGSKFIRGFTFDSRDFGMEIAWGNINTRSVCKQVGQYHDKLLADAKS
jgi:hypothetical protein